MVARVGADGRLRYCDRKMAERSTVKPGESASAPCEMMLNGACSSIVSNTSSTSRKANLNNLKTTPRSPVELPPPMINRAVPGPGDEIEADDDAGVVDSEKVSVVFLVRQQATLRVLADQPRQCEQVSHHPPISAAYYGCPERGIEMVCMDQILARVSGMCESYSSRTCYSSRQSAVRVAPGPSNKGLFLRIKRDGPGKGEVSTALVVVVGRGSSDPRNTGSRILLLKSTVY